MILNAGDGARVHSLVESFLKLLEKVKDTNLSRNPSLHCKDRRPAVTCWVILAEIMRQREASMATAIPKA
jgi:hypothetical protein